ncbi:hypothetical protein [Microbulbifer sp. JMSA003]|uniref:hypothetical protein n=1 Tax=unclassified Microbulbifer TaxID=2619833 RepID=UPI004039253A
MRRSAGIYWLAPAKPASGTSLCRLNTISRSSSRTIQTSPENTGADASIYWYLLARAGQAGGRHFR